MRTLLPDQRARKGAATAMAALLGAAVLAAGCIPAAAARHPLAATRAALYVHLPGSGVPGGLHGRSTRTAKTGSDPVASNPRSSPLPPPAAGLVRGRVTVIGDSVTIDATPALEALIPGVQVDATVGEQWETGVAALAQLRASGQLGAVVVVALGTNGPVSVAEFQQMMAVLHGVSRVVFVTDHAPDFWEEQNNAMFAAEVPHYPTARIAGWDVAAKAHPAWLYPDGTHMPIGGSGAYAWAELVKAQI